jgi:hypothetical protein
VTDAPRALAPVGDRSCGACDLCCTVMAVRELDKPTWSACAHRAEAGGGCAIWGAHPVSCRTFHCLWRTSDVLLPAEMFPADCGFLLIAEVTPAWPMLVKVSAEASRPDAWDRPRYREIFLALAAAWNCPVVVVGPGVIASHVFAPSGRSYSRTERPDLFPQEGAGLALGLEDYGAARRAPAEQIAGARFSWRRE